MFGRAHSYQGHVNGRDLVIPECIDAVVQVVHMLAESAGNFSRKVPTSNSPQSEITLPFSGPSFVLALAGTRWRQVQIKATEK